MNQNSISLAIPIGQSFSTVLQSNSQDYIEQGCTFSMPAYGYNQYGYLPFLAEGLTFDEQTSELSGTVSYMPPEEYWGYFIVITSIGSENIMTYTIVNISYYTP